ncbi:MAG: HAD family phosphatase [Proteobacteria bacterium]|nr:HAD family phosphatase [Pseudomonadota bacterium]
MKNLLPRFRAVIFDMDGLAIDSEPSFIFAWRKAASEFGAQLEDELVRSLLGLHAEDVELALKEAIGVNFNASQFRLLASQYWRDHVKRKGMTTMPGLHTLLGLLAKVSIPFALATNSDGANAAESLRRTGLETRFSVLVTRDQVSAGKPEPDLFLAAALRLGVSASECLVLEDSAVGLLAASRAGAIPVLVNLRPTGESKQLAALSFLSLDEVAAAISLSTSQ